MNRRNKYMRIKIDSVTWAKEDQNAKLSRSGCQEKFDMKSKYISALVK